MYKSKIKNLAKLVSIEKQILSDSKQEMFECI